MIQFNKIKQKKKIDENVMLSRWNVHNKMCVSSELFRIMQCSGIKFYIWCDWGLVINLYSKWMNFNSNQQKKLFNRIVVIKVLFFEFSLHWLYPILFRYDDILNRDNERERGWKLKYGKRIHQITYIYMAPLCSTI